MSERNHLFIFGFGYSAAALAKKCLAAGWRISATSRDPNRRKEMERLGIMAYDFPDESLRDNLTHSQYLLNSIPPSKQGDPALLHYRDTISQSDWQWIGHLSTTGVYGDYQGEWVTEESPLKAEGGRLQRRIEAESAWLALYDSLRKPVHIFRLAGIYGPGRGPLAKLRNGTAQRIEKPGQFFSRIHVEDIAHILWESMHNATPGEIYNVCDDEPVPGHVVIEEAARIADLPPPPLIPYEQAELSEMAREFYASSRKVSNQKLKKELGITMHYPTYREGLHSLI